MSNSFDPSGNTNNSSPAIPQWWQSFNGASSPLDRSAFWAASHTPGGMSSFEPNGGGAINLDPAMEGNPVETGTFDAGPPPGAGIVTPSQTQGTGTQNTLTPQAGFAGANYTKGFDGGGDVDDDDVGTGGAPAQGGASRYPSLEKSHSIVDALIKWGERAYQTPLSDDYQEQGAADGGAIDVAPQQGAQGPSAASMRVHSHADRASPAHVQILERNAPAQHPADKALLAIGRAAQTHPEAGWAVMQHYLAQYDHMRNFARAALQAGQPDKAAAAATQAYNSLPDGSHVAFQPSPDGGLIASVGGGAQQPDQDESEAAGDEQSAARGGSIRGPLDGLQPGDKSPSYDDGTDNPVQPNDNDNDNENISDLGADLAQKGGEAAGYVGQKVRDVGDTLARAGQAYWHGAQKVAGELGDAAEQTQLLGSEGGPQLPGASKALTQFKLNPQAADKLLSKAAFPALNDGAVQNLSEVAQGGYSSPDETAQPENTTGMSAQDEEMPPVQQDLGQMPSQQFRDQERNAFRASHPVAVDQLNTETRQLGPSPGDPVAVPKGVDPGAWHEFITSGGGGFRADGSADRQTPPRDTSMASFGRWLQAKATVSGGAAQAQQQERPWGGRPNERILDAVHNFAENAPIADVAKEKLRALPRFPGAGDMSPEQFTNIAITSGINPHDLANIYRQAGAPEDKIKETLAPYMPENTKPAKAGPTLGSMKDPTQGRQGAQRPVDTGRYNKQRSDDEQAEARRSHEDAIRRTMPFNTNSRMANRMRERQRQRQYPQ